MSTNSSSNLAPDCDKAKAAAHTPGALLTLVYFFAMWASIITCVMQILGFNPSQGVWNALIVLLLVATLIHVRAAARSAIQRAEGGQ